MPATHHRDSLHQLRVLLVFIEFNILIFILIGRQKRTHLNPAPPPAPQPPPLTQPQPAPRRRIKPPKPWVMPWILQDRKKDATATSWPTSYTPISQDTRILSGCHLPFLTSSKNSYAKKSVNNFRKPLEVGLKLAITLRHLAAGKTTHPGSITGWLAAPPSANSSPGLLSHPC